MCSRGSVIPLFIDQIRAGNPVTVTNPEMTRFLMNLDEAVDLVKFAFEHANPGDLFIQKADAAAIGDLAAVQRLFGDTGRNVIGTRHGEKLYETLMTREERLRSEDMGGYYRVAADSRDLNYDKFVVRGEGPLDRTGLFRGCLICRDGEKILGVLEPKGERLRLCRMLLREEVQALGPAERGELRLSFAFRQEQGWQILPCPEQFFHRAPFGQALQGREGALWRESRGLRLLALPFDSAHPFPLTSLFCFAQVSEIQGRRFVVFAFDAEERPVMPDPCRKM